MKYVKIFENFNFEDEVKEFFQDLIDDWDLVVYDSNRYDTKFIRYKFVTKKTLPMRALHIIDGFASACVKISESDEKFIGAYFDLTGPNDFFTTRNKFLTELEVIVKSLNDVGYKSKLIRNQSYSNHFLILIENLNY